MRRLSAESWLRLVMFLAAFWASGLLAAAAGAPPATVTLATRISPFLPAGYGIRWNTGTGQMAYNRPGGDGYYGLYLLDPPDGRNERPLTSPQLPGRHTGSPCWHPSGRYIVLVAEKKRHPGSSVPALPGWGGFSDMWLITSDGRRAWKLVEEPIEADRGMLLPQFSPDGKKIAWCERVAGPNLFIPLKVAGLFVIHVADFLDGPTPRVAGIKDFKPGGDAFYEASCFTRDSKSLLITSDYDTKNFWRNQIYRLDLKTGVARRLTHNQGYNEHPSLTPDGKSILWMSNVQCDTRSVLNGTDWWLMDADGANPRRVSTMNVRSSPQCDGAPKWACAAAWSPDGRWFLGDVEMNLFTCASKVVRVDLLPGGAAVQPAPSPAVPATAPAGEPTVHIASGLISGRLAGVQKDVCVYKGIPFAAPPLGQLRWRPPQAVKPWEGVRACTEFGPACPQPKVLIISAEITKTDEDCLNLNVWAPAGALGQKLPVMVWIHGGAFTLGANSQGWFNGENLARQGVVVVAVNYRLGPLGFLAHPLLSRESDKGVSGNYGLLDQIFALRWVNRNIAAFGGDPDCVTLFGESAGAASVCDLLVSPLSQGLFHRAITESGGARNAIRHLREKWYGKDPMEAVGTYIEKHLKCDQAASPLTALRAKSAAEILKAAEAAKSHFGGETSAPIVDGWVLPDAPALLFDKGQAHDVPFITGSNADEVGWLMSDLAVRRDYGPYADAIFKLFPGDARKQAATVAIFTSVARADGRAMSRGHANAYLYQFSRVPPPWRVLGAFHSSEIPFVFGNLDPKLRFEQKDRDLSATMTAYWVQFAKTGDPNSPTRPKWPAYDARSDLHLEFGETVQTGKGLQKSACDGIDLIQAERVQKRKGP